MEVLCGACNRRGTLEFPILLGLCACGQLIRARPAPVDTSTPPPAAEVDHYKILGLMRPVTDTEVRAAHRRRVQECHPDRGGDADEFHAVTMAYQTLIKPERRRAYDESLRGRTTRAGSVISVPDLIGRSTGDLAAATEHAGLAPRIVLVEVPSSDPRSGYVVGQFPVPGSTIDVGSAMAVWLGVSVRSALWARVTEYAKEMAGHFWDGFLEGAGSSSPRLSLTSGGQTTSAQVAGTVGAVAGATIKAGVGIGSCLLRLWAFLFGATVTFVLLAVAPPVGVVSLLVVLGLTVKSFVSRSRRKQQGLWY